MIWSIICRGIKRLEVGQKTIAPGGTLSVRMFLQRLENNVVGVPTQPAPAFVTALVSFFI